MMDKTRGSMALPVSTSIFIVTDIDELFIPISNLSLSSTGTSTASQLTGSGGGSIGYIFVYGELNGEGESTGIFANFWSGWFYNNLSYLYRYNEVVGTMNQLSTSSCYANDLTELSVCVFSNSPNTVTTIGDFSSNLNPSFQLSPFYVGQTCNLYSNVIGDSSVHINGEYQYNRPSEQKRRIGGLYLFILGLRSSL
jgi:hypothetical protein